MIDKIDLVGKLLILSQQSKLVALKTDCAYARDMSANIGKALELLARQVDMDGD